MKRIILNLFAAFIFFSFCGCISLNLNEEKTDSNTTSKNKTIVLANPENVYRTSTNIIIKVRVQNKNGEWVEQKNPVQIPTNWYIISGIGIE